MATGEFAQRTDQKHGLTCKRVTLAALWARRTKGCSGAEGGGGEARPEARDGLQGSA